MLSEIFTPSVLRTLAGGTLLTIQLTFLSYGIALALGLVAALLRLSRRRLLRVGARVYIDFFRGVPLLVQVLFAYFATPGIFGWINGHLLGPLQAVVGWVPLLPAVLSPFSAAVLAIAMNYGAYNAEVIRAGIEAIPRGQTEAAISLGLTSRDTMRFVILPQAVRVMVPPLGNYLIALLKDSSLASVISAVELVLSTQRIIAFNYQPALMWLAAAAIYLVLSVIVSFLFSVLELQTRPVRRQEARKGTATPAKAQAGMAD